MSTVIVGLNAAFQKRFLLPPNDSLTPGNVHRASDVQIGVGGKGQDVAIALACLAKTSESKEESCAFLQEDLQLAQFVGKGGAGDTVYELLQNALGPSNSLETTVRSEAPLRTCTSIVASDATTELVEPSGVISSEEYQELLTRLGRIPKAEALCIMGTMPPGCPDDSYARIFETVVSDAKDGQEISTGTLTVIDSVVGLEPLLLAIAKHACKANTKATTQGTLLKINASELCRLSKVSKKETESGGVQIGELSEAVLALFQKWPVALDALDAIAITDGAHPAYLATLSTSKKNVQLFRLEVPLLQLDKDQKLYPIGAGDAVAAGTLAAWKTLAHPERTSCLPQALQQQLLEQKGDSSDATLLTSFAFGLACGTASCLQEENSVLDLKHVQQFFASSLPASSSGESLVASHALS